MRTRKKSQTVIRDLGGLDEFLISDAVEAKELGCVGSGKTSGASAPLRKLFCTDTIIRPEDRFEGAVITVGLPTLEKKRHDGTQGSRAGARILA